MFFVARSMVDIEAWLIKQLKHAKVFQTMIKFFFIPQFSGKEFGQP